jgi:hypothetical protein
MRTAKLGVITVAVAWLFAMQAIPAMAAEEFLKTGSKVSVAEAQAYFTFAGESIYCESREGSGSVVNTKLITVEPKYVKCRAYIGPENELAAAKVTACGLEFKVDGTYGQTKGCKIEAASCVIEVAGLKSEKEAQYTNITKGGIPEMYASAGTEGVEYSTSAGCTLLGITTGKATVGLNLALTGAISSARPVIRVEGATPSTEKTMIFKNTPGTIVTINIPTTQGTQRTIICDELEAKGRTSEKDSGGRLIGPLSYRKCESNILNPGNPKALDNGGNIKTTNCNFFLYTADNVTGAAPWPSEGGVSGTGCAFDASVTEGAMTCEISFIRSQWPLGVWLTNITNAVKFNLAEKNRRPYVLGYGETGCGNSISGSGQASLKGAGVLEIEGGSLVEVR